MQHRTTTPRPALAALLLAATAPAARAHAQPAFPAVSLCDAVAGNLVRNCGFETGDASSWAVTNPPFSYLKVDNLATSAHTGSHMLRFSGFASSSVVETLTTIPGARYTFSFYLVSLGIGGEPANASAFEAYFGDRQVFALAGQGPLFDAGYARYSFTETALGALTDVRFTARNAVAAYNLDDVSVTLAADAPAATVPEPATLALVGGGLAAVGAGARRRRGR